SSETANASIDFSQSSARMSIVNSLFGSAEYLDDLVSFPGAFPGGGPPYPAVMFPGTYPGGSAHPGFLPYGWYQAYLGRDAESTVVSNYAQVLKAGMSQTLLLADIVASNEYFARAQTATPG
ncbi:MAG: hypothetical protein ACREHD_23855, partial [Pirellulales bacterium]